MSKEGDTRYFRTNELITTPHEIKKILIKGHVQRRNQPSSIHIFF